MRSRGSRPEADTVAAAVAALPGMGIAALRAEWRRVYRQAPPARLRRDTLELAVAWQLQANALGGLSAASTRRLSDLVEQLTSGSAMPPARRVALKPGARLVRQWGGETHEVVVAEGGFVWLDRRWASLSSIAREITGARWSGPRFFGLDQRAGTAATAAAGVAPGRPTGVGIAEAGEGARAAR